MFFKPKIKSNYIKYAYIYFRSIPFFSRGYNTLILYIKKKGF